MHRRHFCSATFPALGALAMGITGPARAFDLGDISNAEAGQGLKAALEQGATVAVSLLGKPGGFLDNPQVHIPLPGFLGDAARLLKTLGQGRQIEELEVAMNRAAEAAVPLAKDLLVGAARSLSVSDARKIITGGPTSVTSYFAEKTREPLGTRFLPVVTASTRKVGLAEKYNRVAGKAAGLGLVAKEDMTIEQYVTRKSLDGLYFMIGEEEKKIRQDPAGEGSAILRKVFGALK
ncbi:MULTISPECIES: DUF4197 domain-containing protein [Ramlibacter]|uniref:DUF4197 domain-containing protein n=1 Tax=Ramlibacter aquaticus TaxID=2780094 RepID=A0ABR9SF10_9BURK|nr:MULTISPECIES: DUF4197 domain-containing protein [Ramlibacter]MBE7940947.1 DUF4197 domain-containing protein [Ramlibacter aquaticus]